MMKYLSLFSGIGSPEQALKNLGIEFELVGFSEIDKYAIQSYCAVHGVDESLNLGDITKINIESLPQVDIVTHGSPCQDFSVAGKGRGADEGTGTRSSLMWNTVAICEHCKPQYVIWENVKNVLSSKHIHNFEKYLSEMERIGYRNYYKVINAKYWVPQNRERIFVVSIRNDIKKDFKFPEEKDKGLRLRDILETNVDEKYYILSDKAKKLIENLDNKILMDKLPKGKDIKIVGTTQNEWAQGTNFRSWVHDTDGIVGTIDASTYKEPKQIIIPCITPDRVEKRQNGRRFKENDDPMFTLTSQDRHGILEANRLGGIFDDEKGKHQAGSVWDKDGLAPTLDTMQGGHRQPCIIDDTQEPFNGVRFIEDGIVPTLRASRYGLKVVEDIPNNELQELLSRIKKDIERIQELCLK